MNFHQRLKIHWCNGHKCVCVCVCMPYNVHLTRVGAMNIEQQQKFILFFLSPMPCHAHSFCHFCSFQFLFIWDFCSFRLFRRSQSNEWMNQWYARRTPFKSTSTILHPTHPSIHPLCKLFGFHSSAIFSIAFFQFYFFSLRLIIIIINLLAVAFVMLYPCMCVSVCVSKYDWLFAFYSAISLFSIFLLF